MKIARIVAAAAAIVGMAGAAHAQAFAVGSYPPGGAFGPAPFAAAAYATGQCGPGFHTTGGFCVSLGPYGSVRQGPACTLVNDGYGFTRECVPY